MPLIKIQKKGQVTIPTMIRSQLGLADGDLVEVRIRATSIVLTPKVVIDRSKFPNADEHGKRGRLYGPFDTHEQFLASLHKEAKKLRAKKSNNTRRRRPPAFNER
jgi:AbrB family looped-hinge helix DNA binding protein